MVRSILAAMKRVIVILTPTTELLGWIAQVTLNDVKRTKASTSLVDTHSCPIKAIPSKNPNKPADPPEDIGVTAIVAIIEPSTEFFLKGPTDPIEESPQQQNKSDLGHEFQWKPIFP